MSPTHLSKRALPRTRTPGWARVTSWVLGLAGLTLLAFSPEPALLMLLAAGLLPAMAAGSPGSVPRVYSDSANQQRSGPTLSDPGFPPFPSHPDHPDNWLYWADIANGGGPYAGGFSSDDFYND